ncbi:MAG: hypothetical protein AM326_06925 [Candidatus Thorarchaeota archaeon SMTZ-45]|nr:MAG: hypothetical protein AM325_03420 [Candidatus Thorarchaeota archaeon SMTZ1-45]KXH76536.1 MAG: hypothetical protein AM326_06925 [Candidatus Thorarchaeota archaeon SMTZ-45]
MPEATFVVHLDDYQGFLVKQRYPSSLTLNEKVLNLIFYEQQKEDKEELSLAEIEGFRIAIFSAPEYPKWMVCTILGAEEDYNLVDEGLAGSGRLILALMNEDEESVNLEEIVKAGSILEKTKEEQKLASIFLTPSSALLLERMQYEGVEKAAKLSIWLKNQVQDEVDLREAMAPLMNTGVVKVELVGKTSEMVFLVKDIFGYRAPPVESLKRAAQIIPSIAERYKEYVTAFFSPPPPNKGYNPTLPISDPNSPILEDREKLSRLLADSLNYMVLDSLRAEPLSAAEVSLKTALPESIVKKVLWALESEKVVVHFEDEDVWALLTNPRIESFIPEYVLPMIKKKVSEKEITPQIARRHLELLIQNYGEPE